MQWPFEISKIKGRLIFNRSSCHIGEALFVIRNRCTVITSEGSFCYYKSGQRLLQMGAPIKIGAHLLQIGTDLWQIRTAITNWGNYYKSVHNISVLHEYINHGKNCKLLLTNVLRNLFPGKSKKFNIQAIIPLEYFWNGTLSCFFLYQDIKIFYIPRTCTLTRLLDKLLLTHLFTIDILL